MFCCMRASVSGLIALLVLWFFSIKYIYSLIHWLDVSRLGLATINLQTKFEVSNYTHYEDMRSGAKCTN